MINKACRESATFDCAAAMEDQERKHRCYTQQDLEAYNLLDHPVWVFDVERKAMWWANEAALKKVWNADSLESLLARDYASDMSEATERRLNDFMDRFRRGECVRDSWTFYPNGEGPVTVYTTQRGMYVEDNRMVMLLEGELSKTTETIDKSALRAVDLLRHLPVPVGQFDCDGTLIDQNPESLAVFGGNKNTTAASFADRFVDRELGARVLDQVVQQGVDFKGEAQQHTLYGPQWFTVQARRAKDPVTGLPTILYSARDISALISAKKEADEANLAKSEFLAVMAHELRTPLHQVLGFLELLGHTTLSKTQGDYVGSMENSSKTLMSVINDLLDFSKLEAGKMTLESIPFDPRDVACGTLQVVKPKAEGKKLRLIRDLDHQSIPAIKGDPNRLRQLLLNLLTNAVKFTHDGEIKVAMRRLEDDDKGRVVLRFEVSDTGIGISEEHCKHIFNKYKQADASVARNYGGTGLGLAICKILVETMGGNVSVESKVGQGSKFLLEVPFQKCCEKRRAAAGSPSQPTKKMKSLDVLIAEDNKVNQKLAVALLKRLGHRGTVVQNGLEAVRAVENKQYDVILMDVQMPEMDGIEATKEIRKHGCSLDALPIIGLTAGYRKSNRQSYLDIGMNDCLGKPVRLADLRTALCNAVISRNETSKCDVE